MGRISFTSTFIRFHHCRSAAAIVVFTFATIVFAGCVGSSLVDPHTAPNDQPIEVQMKAGDVLVFSKWALDDRGNILGVFENDLVAASDTSRPKWSSRVIPIDSVAAVRNHVATPIDVAKTATVVAGTIAILAIVYHYVNSLSAIHWN